jgi:hypothetical protein
MRPLEPLSISAVLAPCVYYFFVWILVARRPKKGTIVPEYEPPRGLSPAAVRYVWKERFDDRTFWAAVLSLVSKGVATIETDQGIALLRPKEDARHLSLPPEERLLVERLLGGNKRKGVSISMLDERTAAVVREMSNKLHQTAVGRLFQENRSYVIGGIATSLIALCLVARPYGRDEWMVLTLGIAVMSPGAFYLLFLILRIRDLYRSARKRLDMMLIRRFGVLCGLALPCLGAITLGSVVLGGTFGLPTIATAAFLAGLNLLFLQVVKTPTLEGAKLLDQIEGFRLFLQSVERLPMDRGDSPGDHAGVYEKYLPYAIALEVDQKWSDEFVALASTLDRTEALAAAHSFYLGTWNGKPVEMVFKPEPPRRY